MSLAKLCNRENSLEVSNVECCVSILKNPGGKMTTKRAHKKRGLMWEAKKQYRAGRFAFHKLFRGAVKKPMQPLEELLGDLIMPA